MCKPRWQRQFFVAAALCLSILQSQRLSLCFILVFMPAQMDLENYLSLTVPHCEFLSSASTRTLTSATARIAGNVEGTSFSLKQTLPKMCEWVGASGDSLGSGIVGLDCRSISSSEPTSFLVPMVFYLLISLTERVPFNPQTGQYYFNCFSSLSDRKIWKWWLFCRVKCICLNLMRIHF